MLLIFRIEGLVLKDKCIECIVRFQVFSQVFVHYGLQGNLVCIDIYFEDAIKTWFLKNIAQKNLVTEISDIRKYITQKYLATEWSTQENFIEYCNMDLLFKIYWN